MKQINKLNFRRNWLSIFQIGIVFIFLLLSLWVLDTREAIGNTSNQFYLPYIVVGDEFCAQEYLVNGNFEQDDFGWELFSNGYGWKIHDLIGSKDEGFSPYRGDYGARLGGHEGVWDYIEQTVRIPTNGKLTYKWKMGTTETLPHTDGFAVGLYATDHSWVTLESHDDQDIEGIWQQDVIDLNAFEGSTLSLRFTVSNDNYYPTWFDLDEIHLCGWTE